MSAELKQVRRSRIDEGDLPLIIELLETLTLSDVADKWDVRPDTIRLFIGSYGHTAVSIKQAYYTRVFKAGVLKGTSTIDIAKELGVHTGTLYRFFPGRGTVKGTYRPALKPDDLEKVCELLCAKRRIHQVAEELDTSPTTLRRFLHQFNLNPTSIRREYRTEVIKTELAKGTAKKRIAEILQLHPAQLYSIINA